MLTFEERFEIGMNVLKKLRPQIHRRRNRKDPPISTRGDNFNKDSLENHTAGLYANTDLPSLEFITQHIDQYPPESLIVGVSDDGLPFLLDLNNPAPGSLLLIGDEGSGKSRLLQAILVSGEYLNQPGEIQAHLVRNLDTSSRSEIENPIKLSEHPCEKNELAGLIENLVLEAQRRKRNRNQGPAIVIGIDNLIHCINTVDNETFNQLYWLIRHGPRSRIWTIATLTSHEIESPHPRFINAFRTWVLGYIPDRKVMRRLTGGSKPNLQQLVKGLQFCMPYGDEWLPFWLCEPDATS